MKSSICYFSTLVIIAFFLSSCQSNPKWEYKVLPVSADSYARTGADASKPTTVNPTDSELNQLGANGWELTTSYLEVETAYPNFGSETYVTGIQPNVRPQRVVLIFKRLLK